MQYDNPLEEGLRYEEYQQKLQKKYKLSHDIGVNFSKFKKELSQQTNTSDFDEDRWILEFEWWCEYLETVNEPYQTVKDYCEQYF